MENLSEIYDLIDSQDETNVQLGLLMWSGIDKTAHDKFVGEWQAWADLFGMSLCGYLAEYGRFLIVCDDMELIVLPTLPASLQTLFCHNNQLTALTTLPEALQMLDCGNNLLTELPPIPQTLAFLDCRNNYLTEKPKVPEGCTLLFYPQKQCAKAD